MSKNDKNQKTSSPVVAISATIAKRRGNDNSRSSDLAGSPNRGAEIFVKSTGCSKEYFLSDAGSLTFEEWLDTKQAAKYLCISEGELRNKTSSGKVPFYKLGRSNRYLRAELKELLLKTRKGV